MKRLLLFLMTGTAGDGSDQSGPSHADPDPPSCHHDLSGKVRDCAVFLFPPISHKPDNLLLSTPM